MIKGILALHVFSAIIGFGPSFFSYALLKKRGTKGELKHNLKTGDTLIKFPLILGTLAVLTGILLVVMTEWNFSHLWITLSLSLYIINQIIVIGFIAPLTRKLKQWTNNDRDLDDADTLPDEQSGQLARARGLILFTNVLTMFIFACMFLKPM